MPQIFTLLTYNDQAEEAARFYTSIFPNSRITQLTHYPAHGSDQRSRPGQSAEGHERDDDDGEDRRGID
jgi:predicted 3-demethylubiquinone-9 3-methyltransferase (glyoxalase superfamily)